MNNNNFFTKLADSVEAPMTKQALSPAFWAKTGLLGTLMGGGSYAAYQGLKDDAEKKVLQSAPRVAMDTIKQLNNRFSDTDEYGILDRFKYLTNQEDYVKRFLLRDAPNALDRVTTSIDTNHKYRLG